MARRMFRLVGFLSAEICISYLFKVREVLKLRCEVTDLTVTQDQFRMGDI